MKLRKFEDIEITGDNPTENINVWIAFTDDHDGSYSIKMFNSREEAVDELGCDPESIYDDGAIKKASLSFDKINNKWELSKPCVVFIS